MSPFIGKENRTPHAVPSSTRRPLHVPSGCVPTGQGLPTPVPTQGSATPHLVLFCLSRLLRFTYILAFFSTQLAEQQGIKTKRALNPPFSANPWLVCFGKELTSLTVSAPARSGQCYGFRRVVLRMKSDPSFSALFSVHMVCLEKMLSTYL